MKIFMQSLSAATLAPYLNSYMLSTNPNTIIIPKAKAMNLGTLQDVTVSGTLLPKQFVRLDIKNNKRSVPPTPPGTQYQVEAGDGDLHFCLGNTPGTPHIACELQNAKPWISTFNQAVKKPISVSGFFRCMFEHPGFNPTDDAHIFEIHPVQAVSIDGKVYSFDVDVPQQNSIHTWLSPYNLNDQDSKIKVNYDKTKDTLTFKNMTGKDENYVSIQGTVSNITLNADGGNLASFTFTSKDITKGSVQVYCLQGTRAARQLSQLTKNTITMVALRNIDLAAAFNNEYVINLLAIDIH